MFSRHYDQEGTNGRMEDVVPTPQISIDVEDADDAAATGSKTSVPSGPQPPVPTPHSSHSHHPHHSHHPPSRQHQWAHDQNRKNMSFEKSGHATRNASEDSKNIRFRADDAPPRGARKRSHNKRFHDFKRRLSVTPDQLKKLQPI
ncbi:hypothetical protein CRE_02018 [Caenorhabditis remanei]|uniref:Uncharacterized protein n=1 Tax=Caenorhabditis remanei TaxID=31234 RepID=E3LGV0_CAERE|nr:hypothetical protein CRE_02018 [Caenorhabditis remanei]